MIICTFLSTLSLRRATGTLSDTSDVTAISIHALLAESDRQNSLNRSHRTEFLSTLSLRRATLALLFRLKLTKHFYPRSPCGERRRSWRKQSNHHKISIHALLAESDSRHFAGVPENCNFYPRSPCGERLYNATKQTWLVNISIHALLAESDTLIIGFSERVIISIHALLAESDVVLFRILRM